MQRKHLAEELQSIEAVFVTNGYPSEAVRRFMEHRPQQVDGQEQEGQRSRGIVTTPCSRGLSEQFKRIDNRHLLLSCCLQT